MRLQVPAETTVIVPVDSSTVHTSVLRDKYETPALAVSDAGETTSTVAPLPRLNDDDEYDQPVSVFTVWALGRS